MGPSPVLVVGETPSLGRSVADLLESGNIPYRFVYAIESEIPLETLFERYPVVISACNEVFCSTARRWSRGELPGVRLIVVGSRDPALRSMSGLRQLSLPVLPARLRSLLRTLFDGPDPPRSLGARLA
ncbi:MAG: hypothetical protein WB947_00620 [Thermoplasmata archaeon]